MKNSIKVGGMFFLVICFLLFSCKRNWTCQCQGEKYYFKNQTKKNAKKLCDEKENSDTLALYPKDNCHILSPFY